MFAVPGWSLSASDLKRQTELPQSSKSKKRKRKQQEGQDPASKVSSNDVDKLWKSQFKKSKDSPKPAKSTTQLGVSPQPTHANAPKDTTRQKDTKKTKPKHDRAAHHDSTPIVNSSTSTPSQPQPSNTTTSNPPSRLTAPTTTPNLTPMQAAMRAKLISARFRHLNETLYTTTSATASDLFTKNPAFFAEYHEGFAQQVSTWPENPVDCFVADIQSRCAAHSQQRSSKKNTPQTIPSLPPLPRTQRTCTIADLGCGSAPLAQALIAANTTSAHSLAIKSYDLASPNPLVTSADIAALPLANDSTNIAILCLALMGTNWPAFIDEAYRILHWRGELWIAEIKSRFTRPRQKGVVEHSISNRQRRKRGVDEAERKKEAAQEEDTLRKVVDGEEGAHGTDVSAFVEVLRRRGFALEGEADVSNRMFVRMRFVKVLKASVGKNVEAGTGKGKRFVDEGDDGSADAEVLKPCLYKLR